MVPISVHDEAEREDLIDLAQDREAAFCVPAAAAPEWQGRKQKVWVLVSMGGERALGPHWSLTY